MMIEVILAILSLGFCLLFVRPSSSSFLSSIAPFQRSRRNILKRPDASASTDSKTGSANASRSYGTWTPEEFAYPPIEPLKDFDVDNVKPIPYRPFRWGPNYPINLGIGPMNWSNWFELDNAYRSMVGICKERTATRGEKVHRCLPGFLPHAEECLAEICSYLAQRYPECFRVTRVQYVPEDSATHGDSIAGQEAGAVASITNRITGDAYDFVRLRREEGEAWSPMKYAGMLVQDDLAVMVEDEDGAYRLQAGSICVAGSWRLEDKIGRTLHEIHVNGDVPQFREKLKFSMERFFQKQKVNAPVVRYNFSYQIDEQLAWSSKFGPEDLYDERVGGPRTDEESQKLLGDFKPPGPVEDFRKVWYRSERQTLRRMPKTGCILFTIRTYFHPVHELVKEPGVPGRMSSALKSWPEDVKEYKGGKLYVDVLVRKLDELHLQQVAEGLVKLDENGEVVGKDVRTYPF